MNDIPYFLVKEIKINDKITSFGSGGRGELLDDNKVYAGVISYSVGVNSLMPEEEQEKNLYGGYVEIPDEFLLSISINKIGDIKETEVSTGEWVFDIPVSNEKLNGMVKEYDLNIDLSSIYEGSILNKLIITPINTSIQGYIGDVDLYFIVFDDKGRFLIPKSGGGIGGDGRVYFNSNFKQVFEDTKSLTFIPYERNLYRQSKNINSAEGKINEDYNLVSKLNLNRETVLKSKDGEDFITITRIESRNGKTKVYYKSEYGLIAAPIEIINNSTNERIILGDTLNTKVSNTAQYLNETSEIMMEFNSELTGEDYEIKYYDISEKVTIYNDKSFTINLDK